MSKLFLGVTARFGFSFTYMTAPLTTRNICKALLESKVATAIAFYSETPVLPAKFEIPVQIT